MPAVRARKRSSQRTPFGPELPFKRAHAHGPYEPVKLWPVCRGIGDQDWRLWVERVAAAVTVEPFLGRRAVRVVEAGEGSEEYGEHVAKGWNPYFDLWAYFGWAQGSFLRRVVEFGEGRATMPAGSCHIYMAATLARHWLVRSFAWSVPNDHALEVLDGLRPIVEIGAGTGYWAAVLRRRGVDVMAYDLYPPGGPVPNPWHEGRAGWTDVLEGGSGRLAHHDNRTLLLSWPPPAKPMASQCLSAWRGTSVVVVGEECSSATREFWQQLRDGFRLVETVDLPSWEHVADHMTVWSRR